MKRLGTNETTSVRTVTKVEEESMRKAPRKRQSKEVIRRDRTRNRKWARKGNEIYAVNGSARLDSECLRNFHRVKTNSRGTARNRRCSSFKDSSIRSRQYEDRRRF